MMNELNEVNARKMRQKEVQKLYRETHKQEIKEKAHNYYVSTIKEQKERDRVLYKEAKAILSAGGEPNAEQRDAYQRETELRARRKEYSRRYYEANRENIIAKVKAANPPKGGKRGRPFKRRQPEDAPKEVDAE